jgi:putative MATE family efflux protein
MAEQSTSVKEKNEASAIITSGSITKAVWYLAWPTAINTIIQTAYMNINPMFLGHMKEGVQEALAATMVGRSAMMIQFSILMGLAIGASALVARFIGAKQQEDADEATRQSLILAVILGFISMIPLILFAEPIAWLAGAKPSNLKIAAQYTAIISYTSVPAFVSMVALSVLRSAGDVKRPLYAGAITTVLNIVLDYLLIFGFGPTHILGLEIPGVPAMGLKGAAIATNIARVVGMVLMIWYLKHSTLSGALSHLKPHLGWFLRTLRVGFPAMLQNLVFTTNWAVYTAMLGRLPDGMSAQAALNVAVAIESLAFMPGSAYASAATALVGQNLGAGKEKRAERCAWVATWQAAALMSAVALFFLITPEPLARVFIGKENVASSAAVVPLIVWYLRANAISEPLFAIGFTLRGALQGAGDLVVPMIISFVTYWVLRIPLTWLLAFHMDYGATGAWTAMSVTTGLSGIITIIWFKRGDWKTREI